MIEIIDKYMDNAIALEILEPDLCLRVVHGLTIKLFINFALLNTAV
jgi:hypothetical protein